VAVDASGNLFISDEGNNRIRKVALGGVPTLSINSVTAASGGGYQVIIISPYGSVTSAVATLTVQPPGQKAVFEMNVPLIVGNNLILGFNVSQGSSAYFTLLQTTSLTGRWTTNTAAVLTTNAQTGGFQFLLPVPGAIEFYQLLSP
jgi:hypothetical protein